MQHIVDTIAVRVGDKQPTCAAIDIGEMLTGLTHGWRIDDGHHLAQVRIQQAIEQRFVGVLNIAQVDVLVVIVLEILILTVSAFHLFFDGFYRFRQQAVQVEVTALFFGKGAAFVQ
ncbi:hypothetical protein D3C71_1721800 [compost metagenome]